MAGDRNHYEIALSGWLVRNGVQAVSVDEATRPWMNGCQLKNFDYLINGHSQVLALDLKGRQDRPWITRTDLFSMMSWQSLFGNKANCGFLFSFYTPKGEDPKRLRELDASLLHSPIGEYRLCILSIEDAQRIARPRSKKWGTFDFDRAAFNRSAKPFFEFMVADGNLDSAVG
ncbi:MAG: HYExAFE family protein [Planctomycetota bacterium]